VKTFSSRREFVARTTSALGGAWLTLGLPALTTLSACARDAARSGAPFETLDAGEGRALIALAERILPGDDTLPGATDAGAAWFVDRGLGSIFAQFAEPVRATLRDLDTRAGASGSATAFADLTAEQQDAILDEMEEDQGYFVTRMLVVYGTFSDPSYGGNLDGAGWQILDIAPAAAYEPPFGFYDAEAARGPTRGVA
jgi:gluconate 2-dehydrogenase gamma chain